jgi:hypothetical protein
LRAIFHNSIPLGNCRAKRASPTARRQFVGKISTAAGKKPRLFQARPLDLSNENRKRGKCKIKSSREKQPFAKTIFTNRWKVFGKISAESQKPSAKSRFRALALTEKIGFRFI